MKIRKFNSDFWNGFASIYGSSVDLKEKYKYSGKYEIHKSDKENLASDWVAIGKDIKRAMTEYATEPR